MVQIGQVFCLFDNARGYIRATSLLCNICCSSHNSNLIQQLSNKCNKDDSVLINNKSGPVTLTPQLPAKRPMLKLLAGLSQYYSEVIFDYFTIMAAMQLYIHQTSVLMNVILLASWLYFRQITISSDPGTWTHNETSIIHDSITAACHLPFSHLIYSCPSGITECL